MDYKIDKTAIIGENVVIGTKTRVWQFSNIMSGVIIGSNCNIGQNAFIETGVKLGDNVTIKNNVALYTGVICEDDVFLGPNCVFTNVINPRSFISRKNDFKKTIIKKGATIGANATILCGHSIGNYAMVGAGAVVTKDVNDYSLVIGNPAKKIGYVCICGVRLDCSNNKNYFCPSCGFKYIYQNDCLCKQK